ncbi:arginase family protein [Calidifontibacter sp. DB0510]|uniref:Arginase family protein n=1 Tax=Metallococcus carri TaxID=1656884 RepID=A0A967B1H7_9MICO|nr:arginase family protein [Metallococcus carri]NHN57081.1 arginase family protein [Metallococcus carri]NOP39050.1 arginase family protein [Calidifontibacter sp. DB2511S]
MAGRDLAVIAVPYDSGVLDRRMGAGPRALLRAGLAHRLQAAGHRVDVTEVHPADEWRSELQTAFELQRLVADQVEQVRGFPVVLGGNCNTTVGVVAGLMRSTGRVGVLWLDAHGDFNTPASDRTGFLDGQALAIMVGRCWQEVSRWRATVPEERVMLIGARDLGRAEERSLAESGVLHLRPAQVRDRAGLAAAVSGWMAELEGVHLHLDLDVFDPSIAPANAWAVTDGLVPDDVRALVDGLTVPLTSMTVASYDPSFDPAGHLSEAVLSLLVDLLETSPGSRT